MYLTVDIFNETIITLLKKKLTINLKQITYLRVTDPSSTLNPTQQQQYLKLTSKLTLSNQLLSGLGRVVFVLKITKSARVGIKRSFEKVAFCVGTCHAVSSKTMEQQPRVTGFLSTSPTPFSILRLSKISS